MASSHGSGQTYLVRPARFALCPSPEDPSSPTPDPRPLENAVWFTRRFRRTLTSPRFVRPHPNRLHRAPQSDPPSQSRPTRPPFVEYGPTAWRTLPPSRVVARPLRVISSDRIRPCVKNSISLACAAVDAWLNSLWLARPLWPSASRSGRGRSWRCSVFLCLTTPDQHRQ